MGGTAVLTALVSILPSPSHHYFLPDPLQGLLIVLPLPLCQFKRSICLATCPAGAGRFINIHLIGVLLSKVDPLGHNFFDALTPMFCPSVHPSSRAGFPQAPGGA